MEKTSSTGKPKNKILRLAVSFHNLPFSPGRDANRFKAHINKGFSGPMIPPEARGKSKNFEAQQEPTSPKVSCMGQIKHKKKLFKNNKQQASGNNNNNNLPKQLKPDKSKNTITRHEKKPSSSGILKFFGSGRRKSDASIEHLKPPAREPTPSLSQMRRFASSREAFANFDWTAADVAPEDIDRGFYSDDDRGYSDVEDDVIVPFSAGAVGLCLEPRKEINLWKRRTMAQPKPLQLSVVRANER